MNQPLPPCHAAFRTVLMVLWVFLVAVCPGESWRWQALSLPPLAALAWRLRMPPLKVLRRTLVLWALAGVMGLSLLGQSDWPLRLGNLLLKSTLSLWALSLLVYSMPLPALVAGLRWLRFPGVWTETLAFWGRYYTVLSEEWHRLQLARQARTMQRRRRREFRILTNLLGLLFIRAYERAEKVHRAMLARGYHGSS